MNKTVFLDRDGVINFERGDYNLSIQDFVINDGVIDSIKSLRDHNYLVIIITNQGAIAKGLLSIADLLEMHKFLVDELSKYGTDLTDIYFCPHHDNISKCLCRKPGSLLFEKSISVHNVDVSKSFMIGDSERDIIAAEQVGIKGILVKSNEDISTICRKILTTDD